MSNHIGSDEITGNPVEDLFTELAPTSDSAAEASPVATPTLTVKRNGAETEEVFPVHSPCIIGRFDPSVGPIDIDLGSVRGAEVVNFPDAIFAGDFGVLAADVNAFGKRT